MIRIAHVLHGLPPSSMGGTGLYVEATANAQARAGHPTAIVAPNPGRDTQQIHVDQNLEHWQVETSPVERWMDTWNGSLSGWTQWCATWKPDVVHVHHLSGWPLGLVQATPCRTVLTLHDYSIPCARGQLIKRDLSSCDGPDQSGCTHCLGPALQTHPALVAVGKALRSFPRLSRMGRRALTVGKTSDPRVQDRLAAAAATLHSADVLLSPSADLIHRMKALGYPEAQKTDLPLLQPASPPAPIDQGPVRFLFASSIIPTKGPDRLVDAFLSIQEDATLSIAGHAPAYPAKPGYAENLQNRVRSQPNIRWLGPIPAENMPQLMADHDVLVLPSIWPENSPLVVREATAEGLQVVASAIGGSHELAPSALLIGNDLELRTALSSLAKGGRVRLPRTTWPTPSEHADLLLEQAYTGTRA